MVSLKSLIGQKNICVKLKDVNVPALKLNSWDTIPAHKFDNDVIILFKVLASGSVVQIVYLTPKTFHKKYAYLDNDFKLTVLKEDKILKEYKEYIGNSKYMDMLLPNVHIGSSTEFFVLKDKEVVSGSKLFKTKNTSETFTQGGARVFGNGMLVQTNPSAFRCLDQHTTAVFHGFKTVQENISKKERTKISLKAFVPLPENATGDSLIVQTKQATNVYDITSVDNNAMFRAARGNIHLGFTDVRPSKKEFENMVKALDTILGVACVSLFASFDDPKRRTIAGLPGDYRIHGLNRLEYMTLSNAYIMHPVIHHLVFDLARKAAAFGYCQYDAWKATEEETVRCILNTDVAKAREILLRNKSLLKYIFEGIHHVGFLSAEGAEAAFNVFYNGAESIVKYPYNIKRNWCLTKQSLSGHYRWVNSYQHILDGGKV